MKPLIGVNQSAMECTSLSTSAPIWQDVLAQAMTGELLAAMNYASLSEICDDPREVADALEHAEGEQGHAAAFAAEAAAAHVWPAARRSQAAWHGGRASLPGRPVGQCSGAPARTAQEDRDGRRAR